MTWTIKSGDYMKITQDNVNSPLSTAQKDLACQRASELGVKYIALALPYDSPIAQRLEWVQTAKKYGLLIWHRSSWYSDEGWYNTPKNVTNDRIQDTVNWIKANATIFQNGDIFTPKPEPQNMGVVGLNGYSNPRFSSVAVFNKWLRDMTIACKQAFTDIGKDVRVGYWGFDGFVTCGYNNPDWSGKSFLEPATVQAMDNIITVDHYPSLVGKPMTDFLNVFKKTWPTAKMVLGEYGAAQLSTIEAQTTEINASMTALKDPIVLGVNYWHIGPGGTEALINSDFSKKATFDVVKGYYMESTQNQPETIQILPEIAVKSM